CFFLLYVSHSFRPPFPTRRSSDLVCAVRGELLVLPFATPSVRRFAPSATAIVTRGQRRPESRLFIRREVTHDCVLVSRPSLDLADRKSTRLNSSHQIISYAVFCLK